MLFLKITLIAFCDSNWAVVEFSFHADTTLRLRIYISFENQKQEIIIVGFSLLV